LNLPQWPKASGRFYEVWYFKLNQGPRAPALWLRLTVLLQPGGKRVAETWGIFFKPNGDSFDHVAVKESFPIEKFSFSNQKIEIGECSWEDGKTAGKIRSGSHEIRWDLTFEPNAQGFDHVPALFKKLKLNKATVNTPNEDIAYSGQFWIDGQEYRCESARGMQGHIYGLQNAMRWAWGHANLADDGQPFVFEGLTATIRLGGLIPSPPISAFYFEYEGKRHELNQVGSALSSHSEFSIDGWNFSVNSGDLQFRGKVTTRLSDFAQIRYEDTDGSSLYCRNSKVSSLALSVLRNGKLEREIRSTTVCAFEVVSREKEERLPVLI
jgi:hypothetical protein